MPPAEILLWRHQPDTSLNLSVVCPVCLVGPCLLCIVLPVAALQGCYSFSVPKALLPLAFSQAEVALNR